jgi:phospholipid/cholesterol/gamma-HCH transport system ATP-binding protein
MGPSGTGKTILLKIIIGLLKPNQGKVTVLGHDMATISSHDLFKIRRRIGMLFQGAALFDSLTVFENIAFPLRQVQDFKPSEIANIVKEKLGLVGLPGIEQRYPQSLSGGQKKRVGLARALATSPEVLLFDEPTTGLDPTSRNMIDSLIMRLRDQFGITSIVVTHDMDSMQRTSDRLVLIDGGRVVVAGNAKDLSHDHSMVKRFIAGEWY